MVAGDDLMVIGLMVIGDGDGVAAAFEHELVIDCRPATRGPPFDRADCPPFVCRLTVRTAESAEVWIERRCASE